MKPIFEDVPTLIIAVVIYLGSLVLLTLASLYATGILASLPGLGIEPISTPEALANATIITGMCFTFLWLRGKTKGKHEC